MPGQLDALEENLTKIRSGGISPITQLLWKHDKDFITECAKSISHGNSKVLDVGCGQGGYLISLAYEAGNECYGIDPLLEVSLKPARKRAEEQSLDVHLLCAVGEHIPFRNETFDVVMLTSTLQHVANQKEVLSEIKRVLKLGGRLLVSVPQRKGIYSARLFVAEIKRTIQAEDKIFTMDFSAKSLKDILTKSGFTISKVQGRKFMPIMLPSLLSALLRLHRDNMVMKMIEISDKLADRVNFLASNLIALSAKEKNN